VAPAAASPAELVERRKAVATGLIAVAVAIAFADSSVVVLALPDLYGHFHTTIEGVSWVVTAYNLAVAVVALALVFVVHRARAAFVLAAGIVIFVAASLACASAWSLAFLIAARCVQGAGAALLLAGALPVLGVLTASAGRGAAVWTFAGTLGAALGPALGGIVTQALDWRAIFAVQAPLAAAGLVAVLFVRTPGTLEEGWRPSLTRTVPANVCLGLLFGALVGVLFLAVLLVISVWGYSPLGGAAIVSALPAATLSVRPLSRRLQEPLAICGGAALLGLGLVALALLPSSTVAYVVLALVFCGAGLGLAVPLLSGNALDLDSGATRSGTLTVGIRHLGLVLALAVIAPLLARDLPAAGHRASLRATAVLLDAPVPVTKKIPIALGVARELDRAKAGQVPDLAGPFDEQGAHSDPALRQARDRLVGAVEETITRAFRPAFLFSAALAAAALLLAALVRPWRRS
jgi:predicted MFS family arabinose efflux permease